MINNLLNKITMYRLVVYCLATITTIATVLSAWGILPYNPLYIAGNTLILLAVSIGIDKLFAYFLKVSTNRESSYITALILTLIIAPENPINNIFYLVTSVGIAIASKYIFVRKKSHIFNPAALGALAGGLVFHQTASWWVGSAYLLPVVALVAALVIHKIQRWGTVGIFLLFYLGGSLLQEGMRSAAFLFLKNTLFSPLIFFVSIMLIEPRTSPTKRRKAHLFALFTAVALLLYQALLPNIGYSFELALLTGNILSHIINPQFSYRIKLLEKKQIAHNTLGFLFTKPISFTFAAGQFAEITLPHHNSDSRGVRRYFTIASPPNEDNIYLASRFTQPSSSFKTALQSMKRGDYLTIGHIGGDFTLVDQKRELVWIAGGIGITPYRSMVKFMLEINSSRRVTLIYSNKTIQDIAFKEIFREAEKKLHFKTVYVLTHPPKNWGGEIGHLAPQTIRRYVLNYHEKIFYISGPQRMVDETHKVLADLHIKNSSIKTDFFPGYV